ncbi:MAG: hypothetical protein Q4F23_01640 [Coriobacteriia bacterium]|nr:hypothetical protein [Coriobacteriia bacterium]
MRLRASDLPAGFFRVELMDVDTRNPNSVLTFCREWGTLRSPLYQHGLNLRNGQLDMDAQDLESVVEDALNERRPSWKDNRPTHQIRLGEMKLRDGACPATAALFNEVVGTIDLLKWVVQKMLKEAWETQGIYDTTLNRSSIFHEAECIPADFAWRAIVNHHLTSSRVFEMKLENGGLILENDELLPSAICRQILDTWAFEEEPWKICPNCGKLFKFQHGSRRRGVDYCCKKCGQNGRQKKCRAAKLIDHGL